MPAALISASAGSSGSLHFGQIDTNQPLGHDGGHAAGDEERLNSNID